MKQWEDILKERLEGYKSTLPEGSYAEFQKLREAGKAAPRKKAYPLVWAAAVAVAASLAAVLFLRQPKLPEDGVQLVQQQPVEVQVPVADSLVIPEPEVTAPLLAQAPTVKAMPARPAASRSAHSGKRSRSMGAPYASKYRRDNSNPCIVLSSLSYSHQSLVTSD